MLWGTLGASLLGNPMTGKGAVREQLKAQSESGRIFNSTLSFNKFWNTIYKPKFNGVYSINNLP